MICQTFDKLAVVKFLPVGYLKPVALTGREDQCHKHAGCNWVSEAKCVLGFIINVDMKVKSNQIKNVRATGRSAIAPVALTRQSATILLINNHFHYASVNSYYIYAFHKVYFG